MHVCDVGVCRQTDQPRFAAPLFVGVLVCRLVQARVNLGAYPSWDNTCVCFGRFEVYFELDSGESDRFTFSVGQRDGLVLLCSCAP